MIRTILSLLPDGSRSRISLHLALTVVSVALRAASAVLLVPLVAALFGPAPATAWPWVGWLVLSVVAGWIADWLIARIAFELGFGLLNHGQQSLAERLSRIRMTWFDAENTPTARQAVAAIGPELVGLFVYLATPMLAAILLPIAIALALIPISPPLGLAALAGVPLLFGAYWLSGRLSRAADRAASESNVVFAERILEFARTQRALRAARRVEPERSHVGAPEAVALIVVIARYLEPFTALAGIAAATESTLTMLRRVRAVLEAPVADAGDAPYSASAPPRIELRDVSFAYGDGSSVVLDGLDLTFEAGTTTAIVAPSGSGKSTILALLAGLQAPTGGAVLIDGADAASFDQESRRALSTFVFQHPYLFDASVRENVLIGDPDANEAEFARATGLARVDTIADRLPDGWASIAGEAGSALSGGERQRISIARALLKPAPVLLVDEATSALDTENEALVAEALTGDSTPRTRVIVSHRLGSIRSADRVVFVDGGRVVEQGSFDELLAAGGRFAEFHTQQHAAAGWRIGS